MANILRLSTSLAGVEPIEDILSAIVGTGFVDGSIPISCMVIAPSGAGKSRTIIRFDAPYIMRCDDLTSSGLTDLLASDKDNKLKFLLIPDFNPILSHKTSVSSLLIANLLSVTQDGTVRIADGRQNKEVKHNPVGIITAMTFEMFARYSRKFMELGITRRILPLHYTYSWQTIKDAQTLIRQGKITNYIPPMAMSSYAHSRVNIDKDAALEIESLSTRLAFNLGQYIRSHRGIQKAEQGTAILPMSPQIVLSTVARGNAIRYNRASITEDDIDFLNEFISFTDMINRRQL